MARLNEPSVLGDPLEALKRRFIRQNREIARANSTQSQKIRSLECETSRLLSENITLREENIQLQKALERAQALNEASPRLQLKSKLQSKLEELNTLVAELDAPSRPTQSTLTPGRAHRRSVRRASNPRIWRSSFDLAEIAAAEGRLPPIFENKLHPRKTFNEEEILASFGASPNSLESPDPGSPPVAHFDEGDPVKRDSVSTLTKSPARTDIPRQDDVSGAAFLSANLETRKKRKESVSERELIELTETTNELKEIRTKKPNVQSQPQQSAVKRKFSATEEEPTKENSDRQLKKSGSKEDLSSNRRLQSDSHSSRPLSRSKSFQTLAETKAAAKDKSSAATTTSTNRRALGEKPVNTDPVVSPTKVRASNKDKERSNEPQKEPARRPREATKIDRPLIRQIRPIERLAMPPATVSIDQPGSLPPVTPAAPAADDVFSPSTQPSTTRADGHDTPPPEDNPSSRPSRRPRGAVSYAEPSLRDKMRRPTKELVDAVPNAGRRSSSALPDDIRLSHANNSNNPSSAPTRESFRESTFVPVNDEATEPSSSSQWKPRHSQSRTPGSPLSGKSTVLLSAAEEAALIGEHPELPGVGWERARYRRSSALRAAAAVAADVETERRSSASQETIAALLASSSKKLARARDPFGGAAAAIGKSASVPDLADSLAVFDLAEKSPNLVQKGLAKDGADRVSSRATGGSLVRQRSNLGDGSRKIAKEKVTENESERKAEKIEGKVGRNRRRDTTVGSGGEVEGVPDDDRAGLDRAERAERRRSMMV